MKNRIKLIKEKITEEDEGFSFAEIIASIAIMLILSSAVGFSAMKYIDKARQTTALTQMSAFKNALQTYYLDCGNYPTEAQGLNALWEKPYISPVPANWDGPYIDREIGKDPWGNEYIYKIPGRNNLPFEIISYGSDGKEGGEGNAKDIISWKR